jgi:hypothetical protein
MVLDTQLNVAFQHGLVRQYTKRWQIDFSNGKDIEKRNIFIERN